MKTLFMICGVLLSSHPNADTTARYQVDRYDTAAESDADALPAERRTWVVWKYANRLQIRQQGASYSVIWVRMKDGGLQRKEVYPAFSTVVSYQPGDAAAMGMRDSWRDNVSLFDGEILRALQAKGEKPLGGHTGTLYEGSLGGHRYRVLWSAKAALPAVIEIQSAHRSERITLLESFDPGKDKHYPRPDAMDDYDDIDYADIGDNETHPLVQALHDAGGGHGAFYPGH